MSVAILLLEDEPQIREVVAEYLHVARYDVCAVADGQAALDALKTGTFQVAILDIMVPKVSGLEVLKYIRERQLPMGVIMLSALNGEETQVEAFNLFADDYVTKPFSPILLLKRVETLLRRSKAENITNPHLFCDEDSYQAYYQGKSLELTLSEFRILHALMDNPQRVYSREMLIEVVYQGDYFGSDRVIDSHIKNLRKKLPNAYIKTVVGIGYQFDRSIQ